MQFPEITSFGTLLAFAQALEDTAHAHAEASGEDTAARLHGKRARRLEQLRQERLNEVVLQPLTGMAREEYLPPPEGPLPALEALIGRFYRDALRAGSGVLGGLERTFERFAAESEERARTGVR
ncbi:MAG: hypothetical protein FJ098_09400 [Deltaproteobacteria bacterium]|nr:hypothetical protein [Deltaproteobacteria bacterium]